jgi:multicomponent Na+:H+ antiporter subunit E
MGLLFINILLALLWSALTGQFTLENLTTGFLLGYIVLYLLRGVFGGGQYFEKGAQMLRFVVFFVWELLIANLRVARDVLRPGPLRMRPRVIAVPLNLRGDVPVTLLANVLSLTPGTLSLDISDDRKILFVHAIHSPNSEQTTLEIKQGFERLVSNLFSQQESQVENPEEPEK